MNYTIAELSNVALQSGRIAVAEYLKINGFDTEEEKESALLEILKTVQDKEEHTSEHKKLLEEQEEYISKCYDKIRKYNEDLGVYSLLLEAAVESNIAGAELLSNFFDRLFLPNSK